jgi:hypothetical protein
LRRFGAADHAQELQFQMIVLIRRRRIGHQRDQVVVEDLLLAVGQRLEPHEQVVELVVDHVEAQVLELGAQRRPARMLAHGRDVRQAHILGAHDLEGLGVFSMPSWWMPLSWAKAFLPTIALLGCTAKPDTVATRREICMIFVVSISGGEGHDVVAHLHAPSRPLPARCCPRARPDR